MLHATDSRITSDETGHVAVQIAPGAWVVSWLPGPVLPLWQATAAIRLAGVVTRLQNQVGTHAEQRQLWAQIDEWAAQLDLSGVDAATAVTLTPTSTVRSTGKRAA